MVLPHVDDENLRHFGQELELRLLLEQPAHRLVGLPPEHLGDDLGREVLLLEVLAQLADEAGGELGRELERQLEEQRDRLDRVAPQQLLRQLGAQVLLLEQRVHGVLRLRHREVEVGHVEQIRDGVLRAERDEVLDEVRWEL